MDEAHSNKRQYVRISLELAMNLVVFDATASGILPGAETIKVRSAMVDNISIGGMRLHSNDLKDEWLEHLKRGAILLALRFSLPESPKPINTVGRVVWVRVGDKYKYVLGVRFASIKPEEKDLIARFIDSHRQDQ